MAAGQCKETDQKGSSFLKLLVDWDINHSLWIHKKGLKVPSSILRGLEYSGDGLFWIPVAISICLAPEFSAQFFFYNLLVGFLFDLLIVGLIKVLIRRPRPVYNKGMYLVVSVDHYSFPSGHSSRAFLIAGFIIAHSSLWKGIIFDSAYIDWMVDTKGVPFEVSVYSLVVLITLLWATAIASSRILLGRHYILDVIAGSSLGVLESLFVLKTILQWQLFAADNQHWLFQLRHCIKEAIKYG